jgi:hypothetical protein
VLAHGAIGVITEALGISDGNQKEVEGRGRMAEVIEAVITDQALIHPAELARQAPELIR